MNATSSLKLSEKKFAGEIDNFVLQSRKEKTQKRAGPTKALQ